ncbi:MULTISPECIES: hypothetical protein [Pseudomonas]|uniref:hypothetical protein n=1 Tax=Pseudomonas TaxID=286 RepID=UPI0020A0A90B|nr:MULTISPECIES: hypothetical protein [Pseudomonas]MCP1456213.1 hypothetical protein [Pseudomonas kilonensis]WPN60972.1 hypothetical protein QMK48_14670 [Pseudomonas sp. P9_32]WPN66728.1 hypothetical protein QMK47_15575 [Pseudomonas sp. P9_35]
MNHPQGKIAALLALTGALSMAGAQAGTFPDYGFAPPKSSYPSPFFRLSQDYPTVAPGPSSMPSFFKQLPANFSNDFESWRTYMNEVKNYCLEGNTEVGWNVQKNKVRQWYHMPWQHYGPNGREAIHGLTKEAPIQPKQLASTQTGNGQTYAVGIYNDIGAYTIGQVWKDPQNPDPSYTSQPKGFPNGTVVCKALFADIDINTVPSLVNPVLWSAYTAKDFYSTKRAITKVALIQMDIAVRDTRVKDTGWLFGTFQYNGAMTGKSGWDNLVPVGIMWGNDPKENGNAFTNPTPTETKINPALKQTAINANAKELPPTHLGWNGRLNGPVDNPQASCLSCHMTAEYQQLAPMNPTFQANPPPVGGEEWMKWFQNIPAGQPFSPGTRSTDYSLQLSGALANFYEWKCNLSGIYADGKNACVKVQPLNLMKASNAPEQEVFKVQRSPELEDVK